MASRIEPPTLTVQGNWNDLVGPERGNLERILPDYLRPRRWFGGKTKAILSVRLENVIPIPCSGPTVFYNLLKVEFADGSPHRYALPLTFATGAEAEALLEQLPHAVVARLEGDANGVLLDALAEASFGSVLLEAIAGNRQFAGGRGVIHASALGDAAALRAQTGLTPTIGRAEQSNTSIHFADRLILKCFRRLEEGVNLDLEIGSYLTRVGFAYTAPVAGAIEFRRGNGAEAVTLAALHGFVPNQGDAWHYTLKELGRIFEAILAGKAPNPDLPACSLLDLVDAEMPATVRKYVGESATWAILLARRTAEMHLALATGRETGFTPEAFTPGDQQSLFQALGNLHGRVFDLLRQRLNDLPEAVCEEARQVLDRSVVIPSRLERIREGTLTGRRIRCHGDYHLGQVLFTGTDFVIIDFEGEPARPLAERRLKTSPLRDVAGMIRSFHYAAHCGIPPDRSGLEAWAASWYTWTSAAFLRSYLAVVGGGTIVPASRRELELLLDTFLLEKAMYELDYELNHRPDWVRIPLRGIAHLLG